MVIFFKSSATSPPTTVYMGRDKEENEDLIKYAWPQDIWFHVDKLSSAHVYVRLPDSIKSWEEIPQPLLIDCAQLVKANSIEGNKKDNITIVYTPASNLKKTGDMATGQVSFHDHNKVGICPAVTSSVLILSLKNRLKERENVIVNRLNKTKVEKEVDHEQERVDRLKAEAATRRTEALARRKAEMELAKAREAEKAARSYDSLFSGEPEYNEDKTVKELEEDFM
ncbi:hypothetical protein Clacol_009715 [Clathrus columnatus]|uniref:NFACT RNA-binding domain-containing protein n=1 Tax=Clathrus columnatus TaxID=1419009 RepID=A0AAV5AL89_9AGAM|nr:hypothetical protein Clacol_009715 [Clathrus columnatus]